MPEIMDINMSGTLLKVACLPQHKWFWEEVRQGAWESDTIEILADRVTNQTLYIDIGAWIGPTLLFAGARAKRVVGVEPDAVAMFCTIQNLELNPNIKRKVSLHNHALSAKGGILQLWSSEFGNSMTTSIEGRGVNKMTFLSMGVEQFLDSTLGDEPHVFIKVDIESGEYETVPALCEGLMRRGVKADIYLSFHASLMVDARRSIDSWASNLARNSALLSTLCKYGAIYTYEGTWIEATESVSGLSAFADWMDTGGTDRSFLVLAR